jgi:hypothetical protein
MYKISVGKYVINVLSPVIVILIIPATDGFLVLDLAMEPNDICHTDLPRKM